MGQNNSSGKENNKTSNSSFSFTKDQIMDSNAPILLGFPNDQKKSQVISKDLAARIADKLPPSCCSTAPGPLQWHLLYNSDIHGKSFQRMVQRITEKGPTVIIIKIKGTSRIIGAFCESEWLTVASREKQAKSDAAAKSRSIREGQQVSVQSRPKNQNIAFFGSENCFVFCAGGEGPGKVSPGGEFFSSRPSVNSNFMYLFDTHPLDDKIGIGMGGQAGYFGWFIDRWLEGGVCHGDRCTTFQNPKLSETDSWQVESVEVYSVNPDIVATLIIQESSGESCLTKNPDIAADKLLMELHGLHKFDDHERPEC